MNSELPGEGGMGEEHEATPLSIPKNGTTTHYVTPYVMQCKSKYTVQLVKYCFLK